MEYRKNDITTHGIKGWKKWSSLREIVNFFFYLSSSFGSFRRRKEQKKKNILFSCMRGDARIRSVQEKLRIFFRGEDFFPPLNSTLYLRKGFFQASEKKKLKFSASSVLCVLFNYTQLHFGFLFQGNRKGKIAFEDAFFLFCFTLCREKCFI